MSPGLLGQHLMEQQQAERQDIYHGEPWSGMWWQPPDTVSVRCSLVPMGELGATAGVGRAPCRYTAVIGPLFLCYLRPSQCAARPQWIHLFAVPSDSTDPERNKATTTLRLQLLAALLQAPQCVALVALVPGRQLSTLESSYSSLHLFLPSVQLCYLCISSCLLLSSAPRASPPVLAQYMSLKFRAVQIRLWPLKKVMEV